MNTHPTRRLVSSLVLATVMAALPAAQAAAAKTSDPLGAGFVNPPAPARPWVYWFPLDGNLSSNGITADLEAMQRVGIGGVLIMETDQGAPKGPARFGGPLWRALFKHACAEANRLGLEVNMNNDAGWCGSGGPWITPELAMQKVVWTETNVVGPARFDGSLAQPQTVAGHYRDVALFAFPSPEPFRIANIQGKSALTKQEITPRALYPALPPGKVVPRGQLIDLTARLGKDGRLAWDMPEGKWTLLRLGHTPTGANNAPAPLEGRGLECDKLSRLGAEAQFTGLMDKLITDVGPLTGKTLVSTHIDSWEVGSQNWTPRFREEFQRLRGYDPQPLLPVMTGRVVDNLEVSERFLWDVRQTVSDLLVDNYAGHFRELAHRRGLRLSIEAYDGVPCDEMTYAGRADEPMGEFWSYAPYSGSQWCTEMASAAHVYGKRILGAEAFTATDAEKWLAHPGTIKAMGDWAFCEGINRFVFHRYALQPWADRRPGMSMGPWGLHYERTQTWWEQTTPWHRYLARCQFLLQQGRFVADICFLQPERAPQRFPSPTGSIERPRYNFDGCTAEALLTRVKVKDGRLVLPDGMSYRLLVLPQLETMTPQLLRKIKALAQAGATVVGPPPLKSPSLSGYPGCDQEVTRLAEELWGKGETAPSQDGASPLRQRSFGKGRIISGGAFARKDEPALSANLLPASAQWIWRREGNPAAAAPPGTRYFRRFITLEAGSPIASGRLTLTADNSFECWVNGRRAGAGDTFARTFQMNVTSSLKPGANVIAVAAVNGTDAPNPAGLIGSLTVRFRDGHTLEVPTDRQWQAATSVRGNWTSETGLADGWEAAMELGPTGMAPWGEVDQPASVPAVFPEISAVCDLLAQLGVPPDFTSHTRSSADSLRYIHRVIGGAEVYFVANKNPQPEEAVCAFRVSGRQPELWWPETGRMEQPGVWDEADGLTRVPIRFEPAGSVFVIFREKNPAGRDRVVSVSRDGQTILDTAGGPLRERPGDKNAGVNNTSALTRQDASSIELTRGPKEGWQALAWRPGTYTLNTAKGRHQSLVVAPLAAPQPIDGPWEVRFAAGWGAPERIALDKLVSWSEHSDPGVKHFSGTASYTTSFRLPPGFPATGQRLFLDLGRVEVIAEVKLNNEPLGTLWKLPFRVDITQAARAGENALEVKVVNLWINRMIGDEALPEDSDRNPSGTLKSWPKWLQDGQPSPTGRFTFTSWRLWKKGDALQPSGLLGPVVLETAGALAVPAGAGM
jgi:hypothetical protein